MITTLFTALLVAFSVIAHELAHGFAALWQGDRTAQRAGRLTWNPLPHVDPLLTVLVPALMLAATHGTVLLGGARAVPVNPRAYRDGIRGDLLVSIAGIVANAVIALVCVALAPIGGAVTHHVAVANLGLILFNLLPIPPLDGWRIVRCVAVLLA